MPSVKKMKVATAPKPTTNKGIAAFGRVSKAVKSAGKGVFGKPSAIESREAVLFDFKGDGSRKRRAFSVDEVEVEDASSIQSSAANPALRACRPLPARASTDRLPRTPQKPIRRIESSPAQKPSRQIESSPVAETPSKAAVALLERLFLAPNSPEAIEIDSPNYKFTRQTLPAVKSLPSDLQDLVNLHAALLTALSLHYAHNSTHSPADVRLLSSTVASAWGKRSVTLLDIQHSLGIQNFTTFSTPKLQSQISLSDYGHSKICIEHANLENAKTTPKPIDESLWNSAFRHNLTSLWRDHLISSSSSSAPESTIISEFMASLPLEAITTCSSLTQMSPLLLRGQRRLQDFRASRPTLSRKSSSSAPSIPSSSPEKAEQAKRPTLLERLRQKSIANASRPAPKAPKQVLRDQGLHRLPSIAAILHQLSMSGSKGQARVSFTMQTVVGKCRDSEASVSREEVECAVRLLEELCGEWCKVVEFGGKGGRVMVVFVREGWCGDGEVKRRAQEVLAREA